MYPGISDLFNDLFGTHFTASFPPSFGTLVAISFLLAAWILTQDFKRREREGLLQPMTKKVIVGRPASPGELFWNGLFGFLIGFKILFIILDTHSFLNDPQGTILSGKGNWFGGLVGAALLTYIKYREVKKQQLEKPKEVELTIYPHQQVGEITMMAAIGGLVGAKIFHMLEYWQDFVHDPVGMFFSGSGLTMYGGLIVGAMTVLWYGIKNNIPPLQMCDANAPGLMLAYGTGRLGCQLAGDGDWGIANLQPQPDFLSFLPSWAWSYNYPHNVINEGAPMIGCVGKHCYELSIPVFPTPLYESITCIALFFVLWGLRKHFKIPGVLFSVYLIFNGIERFLIESIRVNSKYHLAGISFSQAQLISLLLIITGIGGIIILRKRKLLRDGS